MPRLLATPVARRLHELTIGRRVLTADGQEWTIASRSSMGTQTRQNKNWLWLQRGKEYRKIQGTPALLSLRLLTVVALALCLIAPAWTAACPPLKRRAAVVRQFRKTHPCPATGQTTGACKNWVVDHLYPLCAGGADSPSNMAWEEYQASLLKDRWERALCRQQPRPCPHQGD